MMQTTPTSLLLAAVRPEKLNNVAHDKARYRLGSERLRMVHQQSSNDLTMLRLGQGIMSLLDNSDAWWLWDNILISHNAFIPIGTASCGEWSVTQSTDQRNVRQSKYLLLSIRRSSGTSVLLHERSTVDLQSPRGTCMRICLTGDNIAQYPMMMPRYSASCVTVNSHHAVSPVLPGSQALTD
jgi:hypothetical protein